MKLKIYAMLLAFVVFSLVGNAQDGSFCNADAMRQILISQYPELLQSEQQLQQHVDGFKLSENQRNGSYIIPIVFHIIHRGGSENISDQQVLDAVRILNQDFNKKNADTSVVINEFKSTVADMQIEFRLATKDPNGNCTNGIEHIYSSQTFVGNDFSKLNFWPRDKYMNIWVVAKMRDGAAGYAYYPGSVAPLITVPMIDGVIILQNYIGSIGTSNATNSRALTHELGHCLNLKHPWGDTNNPGVACGDDDVFDTPETRGSTTCNLNLAFCNPPIKENVQNFMDYSYCSKMFTEGQKQRVHATLNSPIADRDNLWQESNLIATGTNELVAANCSPIADFSTNRQFVCLGDPVVFRDNSYNGNVDTRTWSFSNADVLTSAAANPSVNFYATGWQTASLDVLNGTGSSSKSQTLVYVADPNIQFSVPYYNGFEDDADVAENWPTFNIDKDLTAFNQTTLAARTGSKSMQLNNYLSRADRNIDEMISPAFDCSTLDNSNATLSFWYSYATWDNNFTTKQPDSMVVYVSSNCGQAWLPLYRDGSNALLNAGTVSPYFVPGKEQAFWKNVSIAIPTAYRKEKVRFKVQIFGGHKSNNFYLDDWNIGNSVAALEGVNLLQNISISPNPFSNLVYINNLPSEDVSLEVFDVLGQLVHSEKLQDRAITATVDLSNLTGSGVYLLNITSGASRQSTKLIKY